MPSLKPTFLFLPNRIDLRLTPEAAIPLIIDFLWSDPITPPPHLFQSEIQCFNFTPPHQHHHHIDRITNLLLMENCLRPWIICRRRRFANISHSIFMLFMVPPCPKPPPSHEICHPPSFGTFDPTGLDRPIDPGPSTSPGRGPNSWRKHTVIKLLPLLVDCDGPFFQRGGFRFSHWKKKNLPAESRENTLRMGFILRRGTGWWPMKRGFFEGWDLFQIKVRVYKYVKKILITFA